MNSVESSNRLVDDMLTLMRPPSPVPDRRSGSKVAEYYAGKSVFITGATGFIGKALVEKLVRSCDKIKRVYILVREKRGQTIQERLKDLIRSKYFDRIRETCEGGNRLLEEKLYPIKGDITLPKFGIEPDDMQLLSRDCTVVFNSAATIRFSEPIDVAVRNNIYSTGQLVEFCNELEHLEALVHLSTAYSNCHKRDTIYEIFYEPPMRGDQIQAAVEKLNEIRKQIYVSRETFDQADDSEDHRLLWHELLRGSCKLQKFYQDEVDFLAGAEHSNGAKPSPTAGRANGLATSSSSASLLLTSEASSATAASGGGGGGGGASGKPETAGPKREDATAAYDLLAEFSRIALRMSNRPNTYTFTKAISESYLLDKVRARPDRYLNDKIPVAIVRPSIVGGAWREPLVGLVDNYNGPTGAILSLYTGALQAMPGLGDCVADLVPVDMVVNMVICTGWFLATERARGGASGAGAGEQVAVQRDRGMYLFNFVSGFRNPLKWRCVTELIASLAYKYPSKFLMRLPSSYFIEAGRFYNLYDALNHRLPAYLIDLVKSRLLGQACTGRSSAVVGYSRIRQMTDTLTPFTSNQWRLCDSNTQSLLRRLAPADRDLFQFDVESISWPDYIASYIIGSRIYTMRDEPKNLAGAARALRCRRHLNGAFTSLLLLLIYFLFVRGGQLEALALGWL